MLFSNRLQKYYKLFERVFEFAFFFNIFLAKTYNFEKNTIFFMKTYSVFFIKSYK